MQVGNPSVAKVVDDMIRKGIEKILVLPMYPQYSATTWASATDILFSALMKQRKVPALRIVPPYFQHPKYIEAMAAVIQDQLARLTLKPDHFLLSFHGIPVHYVQAGDPYPVHVKKTTELLIQKLGWPDGTWIQTYQSRFGRDPWLEPYTEGTLQQLAKSGKQRVFVAMPGFTADCLETIDEIGFEAKEVFLHAGGEELCACPCLNDHPIWIGAMAAMIREEGQGWL
jgi:ferrochelatase